MWVVKCATDLYLTRFAAMLQDKLHFFVAHFSMPLKNKAPSLILHVFSREINENNVHVDLFSLSHLTECKCKDCSQKVATYAAGKENSIKKFRLAMIKKFDPCDNLRLPGI